MEPEPRSAIERWHTAVNSGSRAQIEAAVSDPVVVLISAGPSAMSRVEFANLVVQSGIRVQAGAWHPVSDRLVVVVEDLSSHSAASAGRPTIFRVTGSLVSAVLMGTDLDITMQTANVCRVMAATE